MAYDYTLVAAERSREGTQTGANTKHSDSRWQDGMILADESTSPLVKRCTWFDSKLSTSDYFTSYERFDSWIMSRKWLQS